MKHGLKKLLSVGAVFAVMAVPSRAQEQSKPQTVPYGANPAAGHYLRVGDAKIYYETYGSGGTPLVLLHGAVYGYIDEFSQLIEQLSQHRRVIAIATRGHGRSEIGTSPFSYSLFASDAYAVIHHESSGKVDVLGFSGGAITAYTLTASHPELVRRLVAIGGPRRFTDRSLDAQAESKRAKASDVERDMPQFVADRKKLMPQPERWEEFVAKMNALDLGPVFVTDAQIRSIQAPALLIAGDHDPYNETMKFVETYRLLPHGELAVVPGCGHVVLDCKGPFTIRAAKDFLDRKDSERQ